VSVTSVMHHFSSKELLLEAVLEHADSEAIREIDLDPARDGLRVTIVRLAETGQEHPHLLRLLAVLSSEASAVEHPAHEWFVERYQRVVEGMAGWIDADRTLDLAPDNARVLARRIVALWDGLQLQWLLRADFDLVAELDAAVAALADQARRAELPH
jgi:AcrR family transcriptional regulator